MQALAFLLLCTLQLWPAVLGNPKSLQFVLNRNGQSRLMQVSNFQWSNCGPSSNPSVVKSLTVSPDPIVIPGDVTVGVVAATTVALEAPVKAESILEKKIGEMWLKLPCVDQLGSCVFPDICETLNTIFPPGQPCPEPLQSYGIPCHCPFKAGTYSIPPSVFYIPNMDLPSFLTNGEYKSQVVLSIGDQQIACFRMSYALKASTVQVVMDTAPGDFYAALNWDLTSRVTSCQEWPVRPYCLFTTTNFTGTNTDLSKSLSFPPSQAGFDGGVTKAKKKTMAMKGRGKMESISAQTFDICSKI